MDCAPRLPPCPPCSEAPGGGGGGGGEGGGSPLLHAAAPHGARCCCARCRRRPACTHATQGPGMHTQRCTRCAVPYHDHAPCPPCLQVRTSGPAAGNGYEIILQVGRAAALPNMCLVSRLLAFTCSAPACAPRLHPRALAAGCGCLNSTQHIMVLPCPLPVWPPRASTGSPARSRGTRSWPARRPRSPRPASPPSGSRPPATRSARRCGDSAGWRGGAGRGMVPLPPSLPSLPIFLAHPQHLRQHPTNTCLRSRTPAPPRSFQHASLPSPNPTLPPRQNGATCPATCMTALVTTPSLPCPTPIPLP